MSTVFGDGCRIHPITHMPLESGRGALSDDAQALLHCEVIEQQQGKAAANEMRAKLKAETVLEQAEEEVENLEHHDGH